ncbi:MAG: diguanylate cyclase [bacterium]
MKRAQIGYDVLLGEILSRGGLPPEVESEARRALSSGSVIQQWQAALMTLDAVSKTGELRRITPSDRARAIQFIDLRRAHIITLTPPSIPSQNYEIEVTPHIPDGIRTRERLSLMDPILTSVATCQSEAELGAALDRISGFIHDVMQCSVASLLPVPSANGAPHPGRRAAPLSRMILDGTEFLSYVETRVLELGRTLYLPDLAEEPLVLPQLRQGEMRSAAIFPLRTGGEVYGLLEAWQPKPRAFSEDDLGLLALLANIAAGVVKNARRLELLIFVDPLTDVYTRGYFDEEFRREVERSNRNRASFALLMVDVDYFKKVNDEHGHAAGDRALRTIAQLLKSNLRQVDIVTRYGGEEFAVLLPGTSEQEASLAAERLRRVIEQTPIALDTGSELRLTISVGGALYPNHAKSRDELLDRADRIALLRAKREGRNRVVLWSAGLERA